MTARIVVRVSTSLLFVALCAVGCVGHPAPHRLSVVRPGSVVVKLQDDMGLSASPSLLSKNGDQVTVTFSGVTYPTKDDWIGVYAPANASVDFMTISPVKYKFATDDPNYLATGNGSVAFRLINMRSEYVFTFMRGGFKEPWLSAVSNSVAFTDYNVPLQGHLSLTPYPFSLAITWVTRDTATPMVQWGTQSGVYVYSNYADTSTYTQDMMCGSPASDEGWHDPGQIHTALLLNLEPGTRYYYVFGDQDLNGPDYGTQHPAGRGLWSKEFSFTAPPIPGANNGVRIAAYGDMGTAYMDGALETGHGEELPSLNTTANVLSEIDDTDIVFHIGDISYARGYATDWEDFFNQIEPVAASVPYMVGIGNHERDFPDSGSKFVGHDSGGECGVPYNNRFPYAGADGAPGSHVNDTPWYSFDFGNVHAVYMSTEHDFSSGSAQLAFLQNDLASVNRSLTPWVIFTGHRPMYIDSNFDVNPDSDQVVARELRQYVEPLLVDYQVDLALWGHHHSYQRTCMVNQEVCLSDKDRAQGKRLPIHAVIGMAGMGLSQNLESPTPSWIHYVNDQVFGYSRIQTNATHLHFQFVQNTGKTVLDDFYIAL